MDCGIQVRQFLAEHTAQPIADDDDIFALRLVNSMFVVQLITFIEDTFDVRIEGEDLVLDNFRSINGIKSLVQRVSAAI